MTVKVRQDKQGRWWVRIDWHQRRASRLMSSQERAIEVAKKIADALDLYGEHALEMIKRPAPVTKAKRIPTFGEYAETWLRNLHHMNLKQTTRTVYGWAMKSHLIPAFKDVPLTDIGYSEMKTFVLSKKEKYSRDSIQQMVGSCRVMFNEAIREGLIERNPCTHLGQFYARTKRDAAVPRSDVYELRELYQIEDVLAGKRSLFDADDYEFFLMMARTGMRVGEAIGIQLDDIDPERGQVIIRRNVPVQHMRPEETAKTRASHRTIDMGQDLTWAIRLMLARRRQERMKGQAQESPWLFPAHRGGPKRYSEILKSWRRAQALAKVRYRTPHSLRHTYASISLASGLPLAYVSKQLGHSSSAITLEVYTHFVPGTVEAGKCALDRKSEISGKTKEGI